ncbi:DUF4238 domain-containing protein [Gordonia malaquae]|uniref:DUF4238 domain-containing protein n=1 Tax=Gordonia malaquae TaxID=410332 RepID=UPI0030FEBFCE
MDINQIITAYRFDHPWLTEAFVEESRVLAAGETARRHHFVPEFHLRYWAIDGMVKTVDVDTGRAKGPLSTRSVAFERDFYTIPDGADSVDTSPLWVETYLSRIENSAARHIAELNAGPAGPVGDLSVKRDLAVFLGLQHRRTVDARRRSLVIANAPDSIKQPMLERMMPTATPLQIEESMQNQLRDRKAGAIRMMIEDVRNVTAGTLFGRRWAIYEAEGALVTCDEPVIAIAGPRYPRSVSVGSGLSGVVVYPLSPGRVLVMSHPQLQDRGPFLLDHNETHNLNREIVANAAKTAFERPSDTTVESADVPARPPSTDPDYTQMSVDDAIDLMLQLATPRNRWAYHDNPPPWPVPRWFG